MIHTFLWSVYMLDTQKVKHLVLSVVCFCFGDLSMGTDKDIDKYVVLVTGGAGFLGQHVVGMLQSRADHVTEIRVLDMYPYSNRLPDYEARKPVQDYVGSINDVGLVNRACDGVDCVMHVASIVDMSLIPDRELSERINVEGTQNIINACRKYGVKRLIYCSSVEVVTPRGSTIYDGTEDELSYPDSYMFEAYGQTKTRAEKMVLQANSSELQTMSLRPAVMYGELEWRVYGNLCSSSLVKKLGLYVALDCQQGIAEHVYVGNVAWGFVCADNKLRDAKNAASVTGDSFFILDDSPRKSVFDFVQPILEDVGIKEFRWRLPIWMLLLPLYFIYFILSIVRLFYKVNFHYGMESFITVTRISLFKYDKAREHLDYQPLYTYTEAKNRTVSHFRKMLK